MTGEGTSDKGGRPPRTLFSLGREGSKRRRGGTDVADTEAAPEEIMDATPAASCGECGTELVAGAAFCGECGATALGVVGAAEAGAVETELIDENLDLDEGTTELIDEDFAVEAELDEELLDEELAVEELAVEEDLDDDLLDEELAVEELEVEDELLDELDDDTLVEDADEDDSRVGAMALGAAGAAAGSMAAGSMLDDGEVGDAGSTEEQTESGLAVLAAARDEKPRGGAKASGERKGSPIGWIIVGVAAAILIVVGIVALLGGGGDGDGDLASPDESTTTTRRSDSSTSTASTTTTQATTTSTEAPATTVATPDTQTPGTTVVSVGPQPDGPKTPAALRVAGVTCPISSNPCTIPVGGTLTVTLVNDGESAGSYSLSGPGLQGPNGALSGGQSVSVTVRDTIEEPDRLATLTISGAGGLAQAVTVLVQ